MAGIETALAATFCGGLADTLTKTTILGSGRYKAIVYNYVVVVLLLAAGAFALGVPFSFPPELLPAFIAQSVIGAGAIIAFFKAFESGRASILAPLSMMYVLIVIALGAAVFGENLSMMQLGGAALVLLSAVVLAFEDIQKFRLEAGALLLALTILGWGYYYTFIKLFIAPMGAYMATVVLETGVALCIFAYYLWRQKDLSPPAPGQAGAILLRSIIIFAGALLYMYAVAGIGVSLTSVIMAGTPLISLPASRILLGERLSAHKYAAAALIVLGLALVLA
jgi:drug/metabolite transporter (DMT)-like permease